MPLIGRRKSQTGLQLARDNRIVAVSRVENVWQMWGGGGGGGGGGGKIFVDEVPA